MKLEEAMTDTELILEKLRRLEKQVSWIQSLLTLTTNQQILDYLNRNIEEHERKQHEALEGKP
jgi:hypothetical protein